MTRLQRVILGVGFCVIGGCSLGPRESFTFQADLPENFEIDGTAYYKPAPGEECDFSSDKERYDAGRTFFRPIQPKAAHRVEFKVPLTARAHGCSLVLRSLDLGFEGQWGPQDSDTGMQYGGLSIRDEPSEYTRPFPDSGTLTLQGQCQWLFRTYGAYRYIVKIPKCRALDTNGTVKKSLIGGAVPRVRLAGKTVRLELTIAAKEKPYYRDFWIETPNGWKPCTGLWGTDNEELCVKPYKFLESFKLLDGRVCTVYPNCTE